MASPSVIFVLGPPGAGKGTLCQKIVQSFGLIHLSAGELLVQDHQELVLQHQRQGTCVPSSLTVSVLERAMLKVPTKDYLIDGFPRNQENLDVWNQLMGNKSQVKFVLFLDCPEDVCTERCILRGRKGDTRDVLKARFEGHRRDEIPIVDHYQRLGLLQKLDSNRSVEEIFEDIKKLFTAQEPNQN